LVGWDTWIGHLLHLVPAVSQLRSRDRWSPGYRRYALSRVQVDRCEQHSSTPFAKAPINHGAGSALTRTPILLNPFFSSTRISAQRRLIDSHNQDEASGNEGVIRERSNVSSWA
jgi:hypothetical protein